MNAPPGNITQTPVDVCKREQGDGTVRSPLGLQARKSLRVLVVEDDTTSQTLAVAILKRQGHRATIATGGLEALDLLARQDFDLVLMDVMMPDIDGLETTRRIRRPTSGVRNQTVPVIALTTLIKNDDVERCLAAGMNSHLAKPLVVAELRAALEKM